MAALARAAPYGAERQVTVFNFIATTTPADITDPEHTLGIEVTIPAVADACGLGNVDPQHGHSREAFMALDCATSAISCVGTCVDTVLPSEGTLVTVRPDLDSIGAMALIVLRSTYLWTDNNNAVRDDLWGRVMSIAKADSFTPSVEWSPSPLPTEENPWPRAGAVDSTQGLAHLGMICSPRRGDVALPLAERVALIACWLRFGEDGLPMNRTDEDGPVVSAIYKACGVEPWIATDAYPLARIMDARARALASRRSLATEAQKTGAVVVSENPRRCARGECPVDVDTDGGCCCTPCAPIAIVRVSHAGAMGLGYCVAPVVIAFDQANPGKVTIAAYAARYLDVALLKARLNEAELAERVAASTCANGGDFQEHADARLAAFHAGDAWGGGATIVGSPQRGGTKLNESTILEAVRACLLIP